MIPLMIGSVWVAAQLVSMNQCFFMIFTYFMNVLKFSRHLYRLR
jgi:hypothetical protein